MRKRRALLWVGIGLGLPIVLLFVAWFWAIPAIVRDKAEAAGEARLGMKVTIGGVSLRTRGAVLSDILIEGREGGLRIEIDEVGVRGDLIELARDGGSAVRHLQARGVEGSLDLTHRGTRDSLAALLRALREAQRGGDDANSSTARARTLEATQMAFVVEDAHGQLVHIRGGYLEKRGDRVLASADEAYVGSDEYDEVDLRDSEVEIIRHEDAWMIERVRLGTGDLIWARRAGEQGDAMHENPASTERRLRNFMSILRPTDVVDDSAADLDIADAPWLRYAISTFEIATDAITVRVRDGEGDRVLMRNLQSQLFGLPGASLHASGSGATSDGGELRWDLRFSPEQLTGEGEIGFRNLPLALVAPFLPDLPWYEPEYTMLEGQLTVERESPDRVHVEGEVAVQNGGLNAERFSSTPITGVSFRVSGEGTWDAPARSITIDSATLSIGGALATLSGRLAKHGEDYEIDVEALLPPTSCEAAVHAIPSDVLGAAAGFGLSGTIGARIDVDIDSRNLDDTVLDIDVAEACDFVRIPAFARMSNFEAPFWHRVRESDGSFFEMMTGPETSAWAPMGAISPYMVHAVVAHEDGGFFGHPGFAESSIRDALISNLRAGRYRYGASTITMQLAKNLFLNREKNLARKVQEVILTWWLEESLEKDRILELYLNIIEYGPAVYGIRHAARYYFGRRPRDLSPAEACFLAAVLPNPSAFHYLYEDGELDSSMKERLRRMLRRMNARGKIGDEALAFGLEEVDNFRFRTSDEPAPDRPLPEDFDELPFEVEEDDVVWIEDEDEWGETGDAPIDEEEAP